MFLVSRCVCYSTGLDKQSSKHLEVCISKKRKEIHSICLSYEISTSLGVFGISVMRLITIFHLIHQ